MGRRGTVGRVVALGLVALLAGCNPEEAPGAEPAPRVPPAPDAGSTSGTVSGCSADPRATLALGADGRADFLVRYRDEATLERGEDALRERGVPLRRLPRPGLLRARLTPPQAAALDGQEGVASVEPDRAVHAMGFERVLLPPAALMKAGPPVQRGSTDEYTWGLLAVGAPALWDANGDGALDPGAPIGQGVKVCVIDSGIDPRNPELTVPVVAQRDFVDDDDDASDRGRDGGWGSGHGTHVAGTLAAQLASAGRTGASFSIPSDGVVGVAPGVQLVIARVLGTNGSGSTTSIIEAMDWCQRQGARILSMSLGSNSTVAAEHDAIAKAVDAGTAIFAASGNSGEDCLAYPSAYEGVFAIGSVGRALVRSGFSQYGRNGGVSLVAPGEEVLSTFLVGEGSDVGVEVGGVRYGSNVLGGARRGEVTRPVVACGWGESTSSCAGRPAGGFVAYVDRGTPDPRQPITFLTKMENVTAQGATALIVGNNDPDGGVGNFGYLRTLEDGGTEEVEGLPGVSVSFADGQRIKAQAGQAATVANLAADYALSQGTSMATPHASAVGALVLGARPDLTLAQLRDALEGSARDLGPAGYDNEYGHGLVQAPAAVARARSLPAPDGGTPDAGP